MVNIYEGMTQTAQKIVKDELKIRWTYTSNAIEGNTVSLGDTSFIIEQGLTVSGITLREHPFFDGNGRVARLLANIYLLKNGFLPLIIDNKKRENYIKLLSSYNLSVVELDDKSGNIIEENKYFENIYEFFKSEYHNSQCVLDEVKNKI